MSRLSLVLRNVLFTIVVPGAGGVYVPWLILTRHGARPAVAAWYAAAGHRPRRRALPVVRVAVRHGGPRHAGNLGSAAAVRRGRPYRWVRNPIYVAALLIVGGEAWLFGSVPLLLYAAALAAAFHLLVTGYEERTLRTRFGDQYEAYRSTVRRWRAAPAAPPLTCANVRTGENLCRRGPRPPFPSMAMLSRSHSALPPGPLPADAP